MALTFSSGCSYRGEGMSFGLSRGLVAVHKGTDLTGEAMGIGAVAVRAGHFTYFAETTAVEGAGGKIVKFFSVNKRMLRTINGKPSVLLTRALDISTDLYMGGSLLQKTAMNMELTVFIKRFLKIGLLFERVSPVAYARCEYETKRRGIGVKCSVQMNITGDAKVYLMNEFSADHFSTAVRSGKQAGMPLGWEKISRCGAVPWFYCNEKKIGFSVQWMQALLRGPGGALLGKGKGGKYKLGRVRI